MDARRGLDASLVALESIVSSAQQRSADELDFYLTVRCCKKNKNLWDSRQLPNRDNHLAIFIARQHIDARY